MNRFRYIDKKILCSYDLSEEFFEKLGIIVNDIIPLRKVFVLFTDKGKKILKSIDSSNERINFISKLLDIIREEDEYVLQYCKNISDEIITEWKGKKYVLLDMIDGREATFTNPIEVEWCSKAIAKFHKASSSIMLKVTEDEINMNSSKNLIYEFLNDLCFITEIERLINTFKYKNEFDEIFLKNISKAKNDLNVCINLLSKNSYSKLYKDSSNRVLCHLDLAHHNFIIDDEDVNIIDFDYCKIGIKILDIYNFIVKVIKSSAYDINVMKSILNSYNEVLEITSEERVVILALLNYPRDFINITKGYYLKEKSWDEEIFISRFKDKIELDYFRSELIRKLK